MSKWNISHAHLLWSLDFLKHQNESGEHDADTSGEVSSFVTVPLKTTNNILSQPF